MHGLSGLSYMIASCDALGVSNLGAPVYLHAESPEEGTIAKPYRQPIVLRVRFRPEKGGRP